MGKIKEEYIEQSERRREDPPEARARHFDTTGFRPQKIAPDEEWKRRGYYPDGEKYDDKNADNDEITYDDLSKITEFDPQKAQKAREENQ